MAKGIENDFRNKEPIAQVSVAVSFAVSFVVVFA